MHTIGGVDKIFFHIYIPLGMCTMQVYMGKSYMHDATLVHTIPLIQNLK